MNTDNPRVQTFDAAYNTLNETLKNAPREQLAFLGAVDALYAALDEAVDDLDDQRVLEAQTLARHAESILTRYFGM